MDFYICGLVDIVIVLIGIIMMIIGYKKGFMHKVLSLFGFFAIVLVSFCFCTQLARILTDNQVIYPTINNNIIESINTGIANNIENLPDNASAAQIIQYGMGWPQFLASRVASMAGISDQSQQDLVINVANYLSEISMNVICFIIIFVVSYLVLAICKIVSSCLRGIFVIKLIDGILGVILYLALYLFVVFVLFLILHYIMDASWFSSGKDFLTIDMQLDSDVPRLSKFIYDSNPILALFKMLGWA